MRGIPLDARSQQQATITFQKLAQPLSLARERGKLAKDPSMMISKEAQFILIGHVDHQLQAITNFGYQTVKIIRTRSKFLKVKPSEPKKWRGTRISRRLRQKGLFLRSVQTPSDAGSLSSKRSLAHSIAARFRGKRRGLEDRLKKPRPVPGIRK